MGNNLFFSFVNKRKESKENHPTTLLLKKATKLISYPRVLGR